MNFFDDNLVDNLVNNKEYIFVSLGNYCITSNLLKDLNLKTESHPFDWMVSYINNINEILINNFEDFKNPQNYLLVKDSIGNEFTKNKKYFNETNLFFNNSLLVDHQHHNLLKKKDYDYLLRCIDRFNNLNNYNNIIFIMIQPLYITKTSCNIEEVLKLYNILILKFGKKIKILIFNITKKNNDEFNEKIINENLKVYELISNIQKHPSGMEYYCSNGINKFYEILKENINK